MVKNQGLFSFWNMTKVIVLLFVLMFLIYPFSSMIINSFREPGSKAFSLENFKTFFSLPYYYETLFRSLKIALITMVITLIVGLPIAYLMTRFNVAGKKALHILMIISLMSPPFIGAYSWIILFGRSGVITKLVARIGITIPTIYGQGGIIMVLSLMMYPYIYLYVSGALGSIDSSLEEAAENLGSSKFRRLLTITMPVVLPSILAGAVVVFMTALADFGTPMLLGEGYKVIPVMIYEEYMSEVSGNANLASALSIVIVFLSTLVLRM